MIAARNNRRGPRFELDLAVTLDREWQVVGNDLPDRLYKIDFLIEPSLQGKVTLLGPKELPIEFAEGVLRVRREGADRFYSVDVESTRKGEAIE